MSIIAACAIATFFYYVTTTIGNRFYGNPGDVAFIYVALPLLFYPVKQKITGWVRRSRTKNQKVGRIMALVAAWLWLAAIATYIPITLRTFSAIYYVKEAIDKDERFEGYDSVRVFNHDYGEATAIVTEGRHRELVEVTKQKDDTWKAGPAVEVPRDKNTFPLF